MSRTVEVFGSPEDRLGFTREATGQEAPNGRVEELAVLVSDHMIGDLFQHAVIDDLVVGGFGPFEDSLSRKYFGHEVPLGSTFPLIAALHAVESVGLLRGHLVIEHLVREQASQWAHYQSIHRPSRHRWARSDRSWTHRVGTRHLRCVPRVGATVRFESAFPLEDRGHLIDELLNVVAVAAAVASVLRHEIPDRLTCCTS